MYEKVAEGWNGTELSGMSGKSMWHIFKNGTEQKSSRTNLTFLLFCYSKISECVMITFYWVKLIKITPKKPNNNTD